ncbi:hypothetical protein ACMXZI_09925 [Bacillus subtilis]|uniref:hypothetical protein n=1 Tax=Bacillus subtilis TaxID=1423 RepID=UPI00207D644A|nr:hypothetical protein [Bacillus subtilis]
MDKDFLIIKIKDIQKGDTLTNRACGNWDMKLSRAKECKRAIVVRSGVILNVYKIVDAWESDEPAKITKTNNRVRFQLAECRDYILFDWRYAENQNAKSGFESILRNLNGTSKIKGVQHVSL